MAIKRIFLVTLFLLFVMGIGSLYGIQDARLLRTPDIKGDIIVFAYGGDLWSTTTQGGNALRLTSHPGVEHNPRISPDGKWIAFSGQYDGNTDVFVIPVTGGNPKRLTFHPGSDNVTGWSADGKYVYFSSMRSSYNRFLRIFKISLNSGYPEQLPMPIAWLGSESPDGKRFAYTALSTRQSFNTWRRYRGGHQPYIWIFDYKDYSVKKIQHPNCNDTQPRWMGSQVYFLSDRDRVMNLYAYDSKSAALKQVTKFKGADIKSFGAADGKMVFERNGYLHLLNPTDNSIKKLAVNIPGDLLSIRSGFKKAGRLINNFSVSPTGKRVAFEARGEIVTVPAEKGDIRNLTRTTGKMERLPAWSPDGKKIAYFGEHKKQYALFITNQKGTSDPKIFPLPISAYYNSLEWSPDSKKLLFTDHYQSLYYLDTAVPAAKSVKIATDLRLINQVWGAWSPDGNWIAYTKSGKNKLRDLYLYSLKNGRSTRVTDGMSDVRSPVFDPEGKYLYFAASTNFAFDLGWVDLNALPHRPISGLYLVVLSAKAYSPFKPRSDEEEEKSEAVPAKKGKNQGAKGKPGSKPPKKETVIDLQGIAGRIVALPVTSNPYSSLQAAKGKLYFLKGVRSNNRTRLNLNVFDLEKREDKTIIKNISDYKLSADGKKIVYQSNRFIWKIVAGNGKAKPGKGMLKTSQIEVYTEPEKEWAQMLFEAWRLQRDYFYDPGMHGRDWPAVWKQYQTYLPYIAHRDDLNYVIGMLIGELSVGHAYVRGGTYPDVDRVPGGLLGADFEVHNGFYRFKKIYAGENWNPNLRAPLKEPGITVKEGDYLLEVNGRPVKGSHNIFSFFEKTAGKQVSIKVNSTPTQVGAHTCTVVPTTFETSLRTRDWIDSNRKKVEKMSGGKLGYVYLPDTATGGYTYFNRYYYSHLDKAGIVLDERYNRGGFAADYIISKLEQPVLSWWLGRWGNPGKTPEASNDGAKAMIINGYSASGGDAMPFYFRKQGLGKLIGTRTWGGLVGIIGNPRLMDGGRVTAPCVAIVSTEGDFVVENEGVAPDIEVFQTPAEMIKGNDPQLEAAVKVLLEEIKTKKRKKFKHNGFPRNR